MEAAASGLSNTIRELDLVAFNSAGGAHGDRGRVVTMWLSELNTIAVAVQRVDGAWVEVNPSDCTVLDRCYLSPGTVVASASDGGGGQLGVVTGVARALDLVGHVGWDPAAPVACGVSPGELRRVRELSLGDCVVSGSGSGAWLGRVVEVSLDVDVAFDDGGVCRVTQAGSKLRTRDMDNLHRHTNTRLYPGRRVAGKHRSVFEVSTWLRGYWKPSLDKGTVVKVEMAGVLVYWVASSQLGADSNRVRAAAPPAYQNPRDLTFFCSTTACSWSVGDRCYWRRSGGGVGASSSACDDIRRGGPSESPCAPPPPPPPPTSRRSMRRVARRRRRRSPAEFAVLSPAGYAPPLCVANTRTTADVLWQDGTRQHGVPSASLLPFVTQNAHDFFPGQHVVVRRPAMASSADHVPGGVGGGDDDDADAPAGRIGVVRSFHSNERTVCVSWFKAAAGHPGGEAMFEHDETLSAYDLALVTGMDSSDHNVFYGDLVVRRLLHGESSMDDDDVQPTTLAQSNADGVDVAWAGHVIDLCHDGHVQVRWGNHSMSKVLPHEITVVELQRVSEMRREMGDYWVYDDEDIDDDLVDSEQEDTTADLQLPATDDNDDDDSNINGDGDSDSGSDTEDDPGLVAARAAAAYIHGVIQRASGVLARCKKYIVSELLQAAAMAVQLGGNNGDVQEEAGAAMASSSGGNGEAGCGDGNVVSDREEKEGGANAAATGSGDDSFRFQQFDVVRSPPDHQYLDNREQLVGQRKWTKRVQKEWKILEHDLPDGIYTRVFEDRMDLLRAVIVGASGTPYQDGLFFFDLQLPPSSYPAAPPLVNYRSFGLSGVNPNLYDSGTVCLSLLGTFGGEGPELWSPSTSTILQVLVSIQGLVLNVDQPYYNEPAYAEMAGTPEGRRNELPYSENAYLLTLQTMLQLLRRPTPGFEGLVASHFRRRGRHVLLACEAFLMEGCQVGTLDEEGRRATETTEGSTRERPCSPGFRLALANVVPRLVEAFTAIGAKGCEEFDWDRLQRRPQ